MNGLVVCEEHADAILEAIDTAVREREEKQRKKLEKAVLQRWTKLTKSLFVRERLQERYGGREGQLDADEDRVAVIDETAVTRVLQAEADAVLDRMRASVVEGEAEEAEDWDSVPVSSSGGGGGFL